MNHATRARAYVVDESKILPNYTLHTDKVDFRSVVRYRTQIGQGRIMIPNLLHIPEELREIDRWYIAGENKNPLYIKENQLVNADINNSSTMMDFYSASMLAGTYSHCDNRSLGVGYVLSKDDPYVCIDLDIKDDKNCDNSELWTSVDQLERYQGIVQAADSYTELSTNGQGLHVWVKSNFKNNRRVPGSVEIYSTSRFIICTGQPISRIEFTRLNGTVITTIKDVGVRPIKSRDNLINTIVASIDEAKYTPVELVETEQRFSDKEVIEMAMHAENSDKFIRLSNGEWAEMNYPSQSEADFALMSMFAFYSKNNEQCIRLFRMTKLGKRIKATKNNYYLTTALGKIRARQAEEDRSKSMVEKLIELPMLTSRVTHEPVLTDPSQPIIPEHPVIDNLNPYSKESLDFPPGFAGQISKYLYANAPRPIKEVSTIATLGFLAGASGKSYHYRQIGLNLYMLLVARSGVGKEGLHSGLKLLRTSLEETLMQNMDFIDHGACQSAQALNRLVSEKNTVLNVSGEFGKRLEKIGDSRARDPNAVALAAEITNLYHKSGPSGAGGGLIYSQKDKSIESTDSVAYSLVGESTPTTFANAVTSTIMEDGFLSRFNVVYYYGERPPLNESRFDMSAKMRTSLAVFIERANDLQRLDEWCEVKIDLDAKEELDNLEKFSSERVIKAGDNESIRQIWNRAHIKACKVAALLATVDNPIQPNISLEFASWAVKFILRDVKIMRDKIDSGEIGDLSDTGRDHALYKVIKFYQEEKLTDSYSNESRFKERGIITLRYLSKRVSQLRVFYKHPLGVRNALHATLTALADYGRLAEVPRIKMMQDFNCRVKAYQILKD